jgi:hypothetical protein
MWKIKVGDSSISLDDFTPDELANIAATYGTNWLRLYTAPASDPRAMYDIVVLAAEKLQQPPVPRPQTVKDAQKFLTDHIELVEDDDLPTSWEAGGIPPVGPGETETTTSSTSTGPEAGLHVVPDPTP